MNDLQNCLRCKGLKPYATAEVKGSEKYPDINGKVEFFVTCGGVIVRAEIMGLPKATQKCENRFFAFHIHSGNTCTGNSTDAFANSNGHYNPNGCSHPFHAGDLPPLINADGVAFVEVLTNQFTASQIVGKTVIIHSKADDFITQPSGNSGEKIACGVIKKFRV